MDAVGAYLAALREGRGLTQPVLAAELNISERSIRNWEHGKNEPKAKELSALIDRLKGSWLHVTRLLNENATPEEGRHFAELQLQKVALTDEQVQLILNLDQETRDAVFRIVRQLQQGQEPG